MEQQRNIRIFFFYSQVSLGYFSFCCFFLLFQDLAIIQIQNQHGNINNSQLFVIIIFTHRGFKQRDEVWFVFMQSQFKVMYGARFSFADCCIHHIQQSTEWSPETSTCQWMKQKFSFFLLLNLSQQTFSTLSSKLKLAKRI